MAFSKFNFVIEDSVSYSDERLVVISFPWTNLALWSQGRKSRAWLGDSCFASELLKSREIEIITEPRNIFSLLEPLMFQAFHIYIY